MLGLLAEHDAEHLGKLNCIEGDTRTLDPGVIPEPIDLCFIDGEHTDDAIVSDYAFCRKVLAGDGAIAFHDSQVVYLGLRRIIAGLEEEGVPFHAYNLPTITFVIELGDFPIHSEPAVAPMLVDNHVGYPWALGFNDHYRRWAHRTPLLQLRLAYGRARRNRLWRRIRGPI